jgi:hypothetical protein
MMTIALFKVSLLLATNLYHPPREVEVVLISIVLSIASLTSNLIENLHDFHFWELLAAIGMMLMMLTPLLARD